MRNLNPNREKVLGELDRLSRECERGTLMVGGSEDGSISAALVKSGPNCLYFMAQLHEFGNYPVNLALN